MVETKHLCEWPGCGRGYQTYDKAVECESQGFNGPDIRPGLVRRTRNLYVLFRRCNNQGHDRVSEVINFFYNYERGIYGINEDCLGPVTLETEVSQGRLTILDEGEFERVREPIEARFKRELKGFLLYREHSYFDKKD